MITLYGAPKSRAFRVIWMLEELAVPYRLVPDLPADVVKPEFVHLRPNTNAPALVDGRTVLWESFAINLYLCEKYGGELWPVSIEERGHALQWSFWAMRQIEGPADAASRTGAGLPANWLERPLTALAAQLETGPHLLGPKFTVADLNVSSLFFRPAIARADLDPFPAVRDWISRCTGRPAFDRMERRTAQAVRRADPDLQLS